MIEKLDGIKETVNYLTNTHIRLYDNDEAENYPPHWHKPPEIIMPLDGEYYIQVNNVDYVLQPYNIAFICPGVIHKLNAPAFGRRIIFQADLSIIQIVHGLDSIVSFLHPVAIFTAENAPQIHSELVSIIQEIADEYLGSSDSFVHTSQKREKNPVVSENNLTELMIYSKVLKMITLIGRHHIQSVEQKSPNIDKQQEYIEKFMNICTYIDNHFSEDLSLDDVAKISGFSKYHFSRLFHDFTNMSFYKYVNSKRISYAEQLLGDTDLSATQVAIQSGFASQSAFIRMFRNRNGCTPTEFRKMQQECDYYDRRNLPQNNDDD